MRVGLLGLWFLAVVCSCAAEEHQEVSRTPPAVYRARLEMLLTPATAALEGRKAFPEDTSGGVVLLAETVWFRDGDGTLYHVLHYIYHAVNEAAVKSVANDVFTFDKERESIFLVSARSILPDGTSQQVDPKATFIQTPQRESNSSLYTSHSELNVIYPNVAPGTSTESIVVIRENTPVIPGEFAASYIFGGGWPTYATRFVVDLPDTEWKRVNAHSSLPGIPEPKSEDAGRDRTRKIWESRLTRRVAWEESAPSLEFTTPTLRLTTLKDWDAIAAWISRLVSDRSDLGPDLRAKVDAWTKGLTSRRQIVDVLHQKVANEVRYTGLEFGLAGYQPYPCSEVWNRGYGDCKDKANLLRAMLGYKGIPAHLVLLETDSQGRVERASPSWRQFNHAIVCVDLDGTPLFCDPTVKYLPAGVLPPVDLGRSVLIARGSKAEWATIPDLVGATLHLEADARLLPDGELSGWFTVAAGGSDAAYYADYYAKEDSDGRQRLLQRMIETFFPGAEVMDTEFKPPAGAVDSIRVRAYFVRPARAATGDSFRFPYPESWLPDVSTVGDRLRPYLAYRREESLSASIALPEGWTASTVPQAFSAPSDTAKITAAWQVKDGKLLAELRWRPERAELAASEYAVFQRSIRALKSWLEQPALLARDAAVKQNRDANIAPAGATELLGFPILASGEGQLRLLDEKFPSDGDPEKRRRALEKVLQWFPSDSESCFTAQIHLARLDWQRLGDKAFAERIEQILARYSTNVSDSLRGWGEYLAWTARWAANKDRQAIEHLKNLAANEHMPPFRRVWSAHEAAVYLAESEPAKARDFLEPYAAMAGEAQEKNVALLLKLTLQTRGAKAMQSTGARLVKTLGDQADPVFSESAVELGKIWSALPLEKRVEGCSALARVIGSEQEFPSAYSKVKSLQAGVQESEAQAELSRWISQTLAKRKPAWWTPQKDDRFPTADAIVRRIEDRNDASDGKATLDAIFQLWVHHDASFSTAMKYLRWAFWWLDNQKTEDEFLDQLAERTVKLPTTSTDEVVECWNNYAKHLVRRGKPELAKQWYSRVFECSAARDFQRVEAAGETAKLLLKEQKTDEALAKIRSIEKVHTAHRKGVDYLYVALLVTLERGEFDRGLELVGRMREQEDKLVREAVYALPIGHLLRAGENPERLRAYWQRASRWRGRWNEVLREAHLPVPGAGDPPLESDFTALGERLTTALNRGSQTEFLQNLDTDARLAQWIPLFCSDFAAQVVKSSRLSPKLWRELTECVLAMVEQMEPVDPMFDPSARLWEAAALGDLGRRSECVAKAKALYSTPGIKLETVEAALRVWVYSARGEPDESQGLSEMKRLLEGETPLTSRFEDLRTYSDALARRKERAANVALLERESQRTDFSPASESGRWVSERLKGLQVESGSAGGLTAAIASWKAKHRLGWLEGVSPKSLSDPRVAAIKRPIDMGQGGFGVAESLKLNLLLAENEANSPEEREAAFTKALLTVSFLTGDADKYADVAISAASLDALSVSTRGLLCGQAISVLLGANQYEAAARVRKAVLPGSYPQGRLDSFAAVGDALRLMDIRPDDWSSKAYGLITGKPLDYWRSSALTELLERLVLSGASSEAERLLALTSSLNVSTDSPATLPALRLQWTRAIRAAKADEPFVRALRSRLLALPQAKERVPLVVQRHFDLYAVDDLTTEQCFLLAVYQLENYRFRAGEVSPLIYLLGHPTGVIRQTPQFGPELLKIALENAGDDKPRSMAMIAAMSLCDIDRPEIATACQDGLNQFLKGPASRAYPETRQAAGRALATIALRTGREPRPAAIFDRLSELGVSEAIRHRMQFLYCVSRGQNAEALSLLDQIESEVLSSRGMLGAARDALRRAGRADEAELLVASGREKVHRMIDDGWAKPEDGGNVFNALGLVAELDQPELIPSGWLAHIRAHWSQETSILKLDVMSSRARRDWPGLKTATDALLAQVPDLYAMYLDRADALEHLGDSAGARDALKVFLQHALNDPRYPEALSRYQRLAPGEQIALKGDAPQASPNSQL
ncbi:hypothetical protein DB347_19500 [Opitutaceae bacterium EW11]|nr:hypothetical protein DB347_19500 [Opitutaceae bacterium EW11]